MRRDAGSWFFLGEIYTDLPLPESSEEPVGNLCGSCSACIDICPTQAIVAPYRLDARRCISYLTIEHTGSIPIDLRAPIRPEESRVGTAGSCTMRSRGSPDDNTKNKE